MQAALIARMTRASMIEIYELNFVKAIRAKGTKEIVLTVKHVFRNALIPIITVVGQTLGTLILWSRCCRNRIQYSRDWSTDIKLCRKTRLLRYSRVDFIYYLLLYLY